VIGLIWPTVAGAGPQQERTQFEAHSEKTFTIKLEVKPHTLYCKATTSIEYYQSDDVAKVSGEIANDDCAASSGEYTISIRIQNEEGERVDLDFEETWQREDNQTISFMREYAIGKNVDLKRVRARKTRCVCAEIPGEDENEDKE
jgi:hypothetical protein